MKAGLTRALYALSTITLAACAESTDPAPTGPAAGAAVYRAVHAATVPVGANDNPEVVAWIGAESAVLVVSSKSRRITRFDVSGQSLVESRSQALFSADASESELTSVAVSPDGAWAVITRTLVDKDAQDETTGCRGELVFVSLGEGAAFGQILSQVPVGPMPDAVALSPDGKTVASANERDAVWGKCEGVAGLEPGSVSIIDVSGGPASAAETARILLGDDEREPESLVFSSDGKVVVSTLQDSHELAFIRLDTAPPSATFVDVPPNSLGTDPWPDGVTRFEDSTGRSLFATAGEASDTISVFDEQGTFVATIEITSADVPSDLPRLGDDTWGPRFRPDSITSFVWNEASYLAVSLKSSGAIAVWRVADPTRAELMSVVRVGVDLSASAESIGTEGVAAGPNGALVTANETEGSVSLIVPSSDAAR